MVLCSVEDDIEKHTHREWTSRVMLKTASIESLVLPEVNSSQKFNNVS
jgi:hypothetical protein